VAATSGDTVKIHYTGTLSDGSVFDSSRDSSPLEFALGSQSVIPGFESAILGMNEGDSKTFTIPCIEAYGAHDPRMVQDVPRTELPPEMPLELGMQLTARGEQGQEIPLVITALDDQMVRLDGNHPLAGEDLTFEIMLVSIN